MLFLGLAIALFKLFFTIALGVFLPLILIIAVIYGAVMLISGSTSFLVSAIRSMLGGSK